MKTVLFSTLTVFCLMILFLLNNTFAQDSPQWHLPAGATMRFGKGEIYDIAYSPDSTRIAVAGSIGIWLYDAFTGAEQALLVGPRVNSAAFSPDGNTIASGSQDGIVRLWDVATGTLQNTLTDSATNVAYSPDGNTIASVGWDKTVRLWDTTTGNLLKTLTGHTDQVSSVAYSPDGTTIARCGLGQNRAVVGYNDGQPSKNSHWTHRLGL